MRTIFLVSILLLFGKNAFCQSIDSIKVRGYYLVIYSKQQVEDAQKNKLLKESGKPYIKLLGTESRSVFISSDSLDKTLSFSIKDYKYDYRKVNYFIPQKEKGRTILSANIKGINLDQERAHFAKRTLYSSSIIKDELYNIYYVEGDAIRYNLENTKDNRSRFGLFTDDVAKEPTFDVVLIYHFTLVTNDFIFLDEFKKWELD